IDECVAWPQEELHDLNERQVRLGQYTHSSRIAKIHPQLTNRRVHARFRTESKESSKIIEPTVEVRAAPRRTRVDVSNASKVPRESTICGRQRTCIPRMCKPRRGVHIVSCRI